MISCIIVCMVVKVVSIRVGENTSFKSLYRSFDNKAQKNIPFTSEILSIVEGLGGSEYVLKLVLRDLQEKKKLPKGYEALLEF